MSPDSTAGTKTFLLIPKPWETWSCWCLPSVEGEENWHSDLCVELNEWMNEWTGGWRLLRDWDSRGPVNGDDIFWWRSWEHNRLWLWTECGKVLVRDEKGKKIEPGKHLCSTFILALHQHLRLSLERPSQNLEEERCSPGDREPWDSHCPWASHFISRIISTSVIVGRFQLVGFNHKKRTS